MRLPNVVTGHADFFVRLYNRLSPEARVYTVLGLTVPTLIVMAASSPPLNIASSLVLLYLIAIAQHINLRVSVEKQSLDRTLFLVYSGLLISLAVLMTLLAVGSTVALS